MTGAVVDTDALLIRQSDMRADYQKALAEGAGPERLAAITRSCNAADAAVVKAVRDGWL